MLVTVTSREIMAENGLQRKTHLCSLNYREYSRQKCIQNWHVLKIEPKYWNRQAYANCGPRSDAVENKGMKLILGNRDYGNLESTLRTIIPV